MQNAPNLIVSATPRLGSVSLLEAGRSWTVDDAVVFAAFRGVLDEAIEATLALLAAEAAADEEGLTVDDDDLQRASEKFRYGHDLISAGETERWLGDRGMTIDDWGQWLYQRLCPPAAERSSDDDVPAGFADLLHVHLWLSGSMEQIRKDLARHVAADRELMARGEPPPPVPSIEAFARRQRMNASELREWLRCHGRDNDWLEETARMEAAFARLRSEALTPERRDRKLMSMQRSLSSVEVDSLDLDSLEAAREAFLCVRDDHIQLEQVAREAGYRAVRRELRLADAGADGERLFAAAAGDVVGPLTIEGRYRLYQVLEKRLPSLEDPAVRERIDGIILDELFAELEERHLHPLHAGTTP